jgi:pimeloyl-ACP methyl ester carboxylesterase
MGRCRYNDGVRQSGREALGRSGRSLRTIVLVAGLVGLITSCAPSALRALPTFASAQAPPVVGLGLPLGGATPAPGRPILTPDGVYVPSSLDADQPVQVLLALHGMGGNGARIADRLAGCAEENGWLLIAPTLAYRDYMDYEQIRLDDREDLPRILGLVDALAAKLEEQGLALQDNLFVYGFSRGGQLAHRFALFYPDRVAGVATLSAGSYTLPRPELAFPFGVADLQSYAGHAFEPQTLSGKAFWVGVGASDTQPEGVPRLFDPFIGSTRLERASRFTEALQQLGANVQLNIFTGVGHEETALMRQRACAFFSGLTPAR